jgi:hypothetical protein
MGRDPRRLELSEGMTLRGLDTERCPCGRRTGGYAVGHGDVGVELGARVAASLRAALGVDITPEDAVIRPSTRDGVDYQCNAAMALAKTLGRPPSEVAQAIVDELDATDLVEDPEVAGPGFINFTLGIDPALPEGLRAARHRFDPSRHVRGELLQPVP